ncbi:hypothetical protein IJT93_03415 [bacterium]|nr:hypothetical protein [bacterium]
MAKKKITSKKELQEALDSVVYDDNLLDFPLEDPNITKEEFFKQYNKWLLEMKMLVLSTEYDICIEYDGE